MGSMSTGAVIGMSKEAPGDDAEYLSRFQALKERKEREKKKEEEEMAAFRKKKEEKKRKKCQTVKQKPLKTVGVILAVVLVFFAFGFSVGKLIYLWTQ